MKRLLFSLFFIFGLFVIRLNFEPPSVAAACAKPSLPSLTINNVQDLSFRGVWNRPTNFSATCDPRRYDFRYRQTGTTNWTNLTLTTNLVDDPYRATVSNSASTPVTSNTSYEAQVHACNNGGCSAYTASQTFRTDCSPPAIPTNLFESNVSKAAFRTNWTPSATWGGCGGRTQELQVSRDSAFPSTNRDDYNITDGTATSRTINTYNGAALQAGTLYYWRIRGCSSNANGKVCSAWATASTVTDCLKPGVPTNLRETPATDTTLTAWDFPNSGWSGCRASQRFYRVYRGAPDNTTMTFTFDTPLGDGNRSFNFGTNSPTGNSPLIPGTKYYWRVQACVRNDDGTTACGDLANQNSFTTTCIPTTTYAHSFTSPQSPPNGSRTGNSSIVPITWTTLSNWASCGSRLSSDPLGETRFKVFLSTANGGPASMSTYKDVSYATRAESLTPLQTSATYHWTVYAYNTTQPATLIQAASGIWSFVTACVAPSRPSLSSPANNSTGVQPSLLAFDWSDANFQGCTATNYYNLELVNVTNSSRSKTYQNLSSSSYNPPDADIDLNSSYYWSVEACNNGTTNGTPICTDSATDPDTGLFTFTTAISAPPPGTGESGIARAPNTEANIFPRPSSGNLNSTRWAANAVVSSALTTPATYRELAEKVLQNAGLPAGPDSGNVLANLNTTSYCGNPLGYFNSANNRYRFYCYGQNQIDEIIASLPVNNSNSSPLYILIPHPGTNLPGGSETLDSAGTGMTISNRRILLFVNSSLTINDDITVDSSVANNPWSSLMVILDVAGGSPGDLTVPATLQRLDGFYVFPGAFRDGATNQYRLVGTGALINTGSSGMASPNGFQRTINTDGPDADAIIDSSEEWTYNSKYLYLYKDVLTTPTYVWKEEAP